MFLFIYLWSLTTINIIWNRVLWTKRAIGKWPTIGAPAITLCRVDCLESTKSLGHLFLQHALVPGLRNLHGSFQPASVHVHSGIEGGGSHRWQHVWP